MAFEVSEMSFQGGSDAGRQAVVQSIEQLLESWCALDERAYLAWLAPGVTRISRVTGIDRGIDAVVAALPREWEEYERPRGEIAVSMAIRDAEIALDEERAYAVYAVEVKGQGSVRWEFSDRWLVYQVFELDRENRYRLAHQAIASDLDEPGTEKGFEFEFAVPVVDLSRAVAFYTPLLGAAEVREAERAIFRAGGNRFVLDATGLEGFASVRPSLPNGYATIHVDDLEDSEMAPVRRFATKSGDRAAIELDPSGNPFVLLEKRFATDGPAPGPPVFENPPPEPLGAMLSAWLKADGPGLLATLSPDAFFFDNSRARSPRIASRFRGAPTGTPGR